MRTKVYPLTGQTVNAALLASGNGAAASLAALAVGEAFVAHGAATVAAVQGTATGTALTLLAAGVLESPSTITLTNGTSDLSTGAVAIVGTDVLGNAITESLAGPNHNTVTSVHTYAAITSLTTDGNAVWSGGHNISAGTTAALLPLTSTQVSVAAGQALGAGIMTLANAGVLASPGKLTLTSIVDVSAIAFAIVGTNALGATISESLLGPLGTGVPVTVSSVNTYYSITSITPAANAAQRVGAGSSLLVIPSSKLTIKSLGTTLVGTTFSIVGHDASGSPQTQVVTGPGAGLTVTTTDVWSDVTSITPSLSVGAGAEAQIGIPLSTAATAGVNILGAAYVFGTQQTFSGFGGTNMNPAPGVPMELTITQGVGSLANSYIIKGLNRWGMPITETVPTATGAAAYASAKVYSRVDSITPTVNDTVGFTIGVPARVTTPWVQLNQTRGKDQAQLAYVTVDGVLASPAWTLEGTAASLNEQGLLPGLGNLPTYTGDSAPIDYAATPTFTVPAPIPQGLQWVRLVNTGNTGSGAVARFVRPSF